MTTFGGLPVPLAVFAAGLLVAYLALFPALFTLAVARFHRAFGERALLLAPPVWVATELGRQYIWDGFPWALLGYSQMPYLPVVQIASVVGVYGVSALLACSGVAAAGLVVGRGRSRWVLTASVAALVAGCTLWGFLRLQSSTLLTEGQPVRVGVLQGNVPQGEKWAPERADEITARYVSMTRQAVAQGASFVLWPESSAPFYLEQDPQNRGQALRRLAVEAGVTLLIGSDQAEPILSPPGGASGRARFRFYNAAFLVKPDGRTGAVYRKMHLVPFGEYVPLQSLLFFVGPIIAGTGDFAPFTAGTEPVLIPVDGHRASVAICYEVIYTNLIRRFVEDGSELLTTITNDAWYGRTSAAYQHWQQATMRAVESGRYLARAANTGISGFVDPYGRVIEATALFEPAVAVRDVRFLQGRTIYSRIGDLVAWLSLAVTVAAVIACKKKF
jgi:apolipoprotein N-acyltransferase